MARRKRRRKTRIIETQRQFVRRDQVSITGEADYIIGRARENDAHVVVFGPLVFFSTETGDAWMLDPDDNLTLCLAQGGEVQPFTITETATNFGNQPPRSKLRGMTGISYPQNAASREESDPTQIERQHCRHICILT